MKSLLTGFLLLQLLLSAIAAETNRKVHIAVASNFAHTLNQLTPLFEQQTGISVVVSAGSSGKLYAQIANGAPYDVFLSADKQRAERLEITGLAVVNTRFTYAIGKLVVFHPHLQQFSLTDLSHNHISRVAIANPKLAPYGLAAKQTMQSLNVWDIAQFQLIRGENVSQTLQFARTGNVDLAFVSKAAMLALDETHFTEVPVSLYGPIEQQAVQVSHLKAAADFLNFLQSKQATSIIQQNGYLTP